MLGVGEYFWRLLPANPILLRVVETGGKKKRDLFIRCGYLALLIIVVLFALISSSNAATGTMSLSDLTTTSKQTFRMMSYLQLTLVALLAPIFTAGAITQEKDSQTYDILLATPLTNGQIVLGSLMSRLFFVIALLISGIPVFSVTQIFGGVAIASIVMSFAIAAATAFVTGSLAMAIATFKVGTRRTIFSFYLFVVIYIVGILLLDQLPYFWIAGPRTTTTTSHISWFTGIHPFLALRVILGDPTYRPPEPGMLPATLQGWPFNWYFTNPASFYVTLMFTFSLLLVTPSIVLLRRMAQSTSSLQSWFLQKLKLSTGDKTRKPRTVWFNPIAWREAKTKASAARASVLRYGFIAAGLTGAIVLVVMFSSYASKPAKYITSNSFDLTTRNLYIFGESTYGVPENFTAIQLNGEPTTIESLRGYYEVKSVTTAINNRKNNTKEITSLMLGSVPRKLDEKAVRQFLMGMTILEFAVILLIVTNAAASTVTREKEDGSLDLLLTTPITSRYYIWGKLRGLVSFVIPLLAVPVVSAGIFVAYDCIRLLQGDTNFRWIVLPEAVLVLPGTLIIVAAFASILGMQMSLRCRTTVRAVMSSVGIMLGACGALGWCGYSFLSSGRGSDNAFMLALSSFSPFTVMMLMIDPWETAGRAFNPANPADIASNRILIFIVSWIATGAYALAVWTMYKSMVKNFDMTIRRQSR
ncbi:MAG: ABC transporter permease subunit [Anaerolineae bacterium]|nr:ABC transporter permease subunit [Phycisphaerae bacterium]